MRLTDALPSLCQRLTFSVRYGPEPWRYRVLGEKGELRVVSAAGRAEPDVVLCAIHPYTYTPIRHPWP
jgi:hypothetical protein